jgi:hypothetical protein
MLTHVNESYTCSTAVLRLFQTPAKYLNASLLLTNLQSPQHQDAVDLLVSRLHETKEVYKCVGVLAAQLAALDTLSLPSTLGKSPAELRREWSEYRQQAKSSWLDNLPNKKNWIASCGSVPAQGQYGTGNWLHEVRDSLPQTPEPIKQLTRRAYISPST